MRGTDCHQILRRRALRVATDSGQCVLAKHLLPIRGLGNPPFHKGDQGLAPQPREDIRSRHVEVRRERLSKTGKAFD
jgi:hypothetical protein